MFGQIVYFSDLGMLKEALYNKGVIGIWFKDDAAMIFWLIVLGLVCLFAFIGLISVIAFFAGRRRKAKKPQMGWRY
jgi:hypothetical protein